MNEYKQQAIDFLEKTGVTFECKFDRYGKHFDDDTDSRDIYTITLTRGSRSYTFKFGQSINCSMQWIANTIYTQNVWRQKGYPRLMGTRNEAARTLGFFSASQCIIIKNEHYSEPNEYDVLACLTKYDPETFEDFCSEFGYDEDSRKAEKIYQAVREEYQNVAMLWSDEEMEELMEIQ